MWKLYPGVEKSAPHSEEGRERMESKKMPVHVVKLGKVQANVWRNETKHGARFNVTVFRLYIENGEWKRSDSFGRDELLSAARAFEGAFDWIWTQCKAGDEGFQDGAV
jgi:hypothetical protein